MRIPIAEPDLNDKELEYVTNAIKSGWISSKGSYILKFEEKFANYIQTRFGTATSSGTTALHLALESLKIKAGDEVIIPALTFIATANVVRYCSAKPVFVDIHPDYWGIDPEKIKEKISPNTKAIIPVHLYGHPCDMDPIMELADEYDLYVIEDAAEAHGAEYKGQKVGGFGHISCYSFYGNKIITTGEGGMCVTNDEKLTEKMKILRDHGMNPKRRYWHDYIGFNYRMTNIQAAIGLAQLEKIDLFIEKKRQIAKWYAKELESLSGKNLISLPKEMKWAKNVYWLFSVLIKSTGKKKRDKIIQLLDENGVDSRPFFYPIPTMTPYQSQTTNSFPISQIISKEGLSLPSSTLLSFNDIKKICQVLTASL